MLKKLRSNLITSPKTTKKGALASAVIAIIGTIAIEIGKNNPVLGEIIGANSEYIYYALAFAVTSIFSLFGAKEDK